ncbi:hypothetical protein Agub_g6681, partial [Astrephomene gubernaculifera]
AGQSPIGEAFLIGKGAPHRLQGEWRDVCRLMTARLPPLRCCLLDAVAAADAPEGTGAGGRAKAAAAGKPAAASGLPGASAAAGVGTAAAAAAAVPAGGKAKAAAEGSGETHLQRMLLEGIANGSVSTGATVEALIKSTLLFQQAGYDQIAAATHSALTSLRQRRLVTFSQHSPQRQAGGGPGSAAAAGPGSGKVPQRSAAGKGTAVAAGLRVTQGAGGAGGGASVAAGALWQPTQVGRAIYESSLPTGIGQELYGRLLRALEGLALEGGLQLLYLLQSEPLPVEIANWEVWAAMLEGLPREPHRRVAEVLGVTPGYAQRLATGRRGSPEESGRHNRFASACLLHDVMCEGDLRDLEQSWGAAGGLTKNGISRGQLQKLQADLSQWAGMAAVMAG